MLAQIEEDQPDRTEYPTEGVRIGINYHDQTLGKHRPRFVLDHPVVDILRRGLSYPRCHIDGDFVHGIRIWCAEQGGLALTGSGTGRMSFTVPARRVRGREQAVPMMDVPFQWERDETGPVLLIPRLPDELIPELVLDKLPNSQVDASTIMARPDARLKREMSMLDVTTPETVEVSDQAELGRSEVPAAVQEAPPGPATDVEPPSSHAVDLKEALAMVNELVDQLGDGVVLSIDANGHVQAKRRVVQYIDL